MESTANAAPELKRDRFPNAFRIGKNTHIQPREKTIKNSWYAFINLIKHTFKAYENGLILKC